MEMRRKNFAVVALALACLLAITMTDISCVSAKSAGVKGAKAKSTDFRTIKVSWDALSEKDGVEISYRINRAESKDGKYKIVATTKSAKYKDKGLTPAETYYYRIDAFDSEGEELGSSAIVKATVKKQKKASLSVLKKNGSWFDFREEAGQKLYKYDTLQGACANDGHAYLTLYNREVEKCKIVKVKLSTLEVEKVSKPLPIYHANNLTFNTKKNVIVATCCRVKEKRAVLIDPKKLKVVSTKDIKLTSKVKNLPSSVLNSYSGFTAIAYNEKKDIYIGRLRDDNNVIIFNGNLKPKKYVKLSGKNEALLNQGMDSKGKYIYDVRSFKGNKKYSMVTIHTLKGKFVGQIKFPFGKRPGNELQCVFHDGDQFYAGIYRTSSQMHDTKKNRVKRDNKLYRLNNL
jgi:Fibronectin type III domain.